MPKIPAFLGIAVIVLAGLAPPTAQVQDFCTCSGEIEEEPVTLQLPPDCEELRDRALGEAVGDWVNCLTEISDWERTMLQNSEQIHRDVQSVIMRVRNENILIATGQYFAKATAANALYLGCLAASRVTLSGRVATRCSSIYAATMTALTKAHNAKLDEINEEANEGLEEAGIARIGRDRLIRENVQRRRIEVLLQYWDALVSSHGGLPRLLARSRDRRG